MENENVKVKGEAVILPESKSNRIAAPGSKADLRLAKTLAMETSKLLTELFEAEEI